MSVPTRGERNNNPGNIRKGESWLGLSKVQTDSTFDQFDSVEFGIRAIEKILLSYNKRGLNTITKIINSWAPTNENNTSSYIKAVASDMKCGPDDIIDVTNQWDALGIIKAIIIHENGRNIYSDDVICVAINMALT